MQPTRLTWRAMFRTSWEWVQLVVGAIGHVHVGEERWLRFHTFHPMCGACFRSWRWSRIRWMVVIALGFIAICAGALAAILGLLFGYFGIMNDRDTHLAISTGWAGALVLVASVAAVRVGQHMQIPHALRRIGSAPVELEALQIGEPPIEDEYGDDELPEPADAQSGHT